MTQGELFKIERKRTCTVCLRSRPVRFFVHDCPSRTSTSRICITCRGRRYREGGGKARLVRIAENHFAKHLRLKFGMSLLEHGALFAEAQQRCCVPGCMRRSGRKLHVDHCHETGLIRGILCPTHNSGGIIEAILRVAPACSWISAMMGLWLARGWFVDELKARWIRRPRRSRTEDGIWALPAEANLVGPDGLPIRKHPEMFPFVLNESVLTPTGRAAYEKALADHGFRAIREN